MNTKLNAKVLVIMVAFLFFTFVNININPMYWGVFSRVVFGVVTVIVILTQL
jgi:hypothetical protein